MPSRRSSPRVSNLSSNDDEIIIFNDLVFKLQLLLPQLNQTHQPSRASSTVLEETCSYIRKLESEVAELSGKLSQLLGSTNNLDLDIDYITSLLQL